MTRTTSQLALSTLLALLVGAASAQTSGTGTAGGTTANPGTATQSDTTQATKDSQIARSDAAFLKQAAQNGIAEVESSKIALNKAVNPKVKSFAQHMVDTHTKANEELTSLAASKGVEVPNEPSLMQRAKMRLLSAADGESFDRRYADSMGVNAHQDTVELFEKAAAEAKDPDIKAFAAKTLPTLQEHLQMAEDMKSATGAQDKAESGGQK
jgi:putative membrane protein